MYKIYQILNIMNLNLIIANKKAKVLIIVNVYGYLNQVKILIEEEELQYINKSKIFKK